MKRYNNLFDKIITMENLQLAHKKASKGKSHYKEVKMVNENLEYYLSKIQKSLIDGSYITSKYQTMEVKEKGKIRTIHKLPYYPDRIVQWAILLVIEPIFISTFTNDTYSAIPKRGIHQIVTRLKNTLHTKEDYYCLKFDIKKYYESINHKILKTLLRKKIKDQKLLLLLDEIIASVGDENQIPIGNYTSQYFANFYLCYFDHWIKENLRIKYYFRYMDDMILIHNSKRYLHKIFGIIKLYLDEKLKLIIKSNWQIFPINKRGVDFVGYRFFYKYVLLRKNICNRFKKKINTTRNKEHLKRSLASYKGWMQWGNCYNLLLKYGV